jgi:hypothetical protein
MSEEQENREKLWQGVEFKDALQDIVARAATGHKYAELAEIVKDDENEDGLERDELTDVDKTVNLLGHLFTYYGTKRLGDDFDKLPFHQQMSVVGGIIHRFTAGLPDGAGFAEVKMENSEWQCLLVRKGSGYQKEVNALIAASEE